MRVHSLYWFLFVCDLATSSRTSLEILLDALLEDGEHSTSALSLIQVRSEVFDGASVNRTSLEDRSLESEVEATLLAASRDFTDINAPGCYVLMPAGCPKHPDEWDPQEYRRDLYGEKEANAGRSKFACEHSRKKTLSVHCGTANVSMLFVQEDTSKPGCYVRTPSGCPNHIQVFNAVDWSRDNYGEEHEDASSSSRSCLDVRKREYIEYCGVDDIEMWYMPQAGLTQPAAEPDLPYAPQHPPLSESEQPPSIGLNQTEQTVLVAENRADSAYVAGLSPQCREGCYSDEHAALKWEGQRCSWHTCLSCPECSLAGTQKASEDGPGQSFSSGSKPSNLTASELVCTDSCHSVEHDHLRWVGTKCDWKCCYGCAECIVSSSSDTVVAFPADKSSRSAWYVAFACACSFFFVLVTQIALQKLKLTWLPDSAVVILIGIGLGFYLKLQGLGADDQIFADHRQFSDFAAVFINFLLLPPIIFQVGWSLRRTELLSGLPLVLALGVAGTLVSISVIGECLTLTEQFGLHNISHRRTAYAIAALMSATNPSAMLSTYSTLRVEPFLKTLVEGESLANNVVAVVIFTVLNSNVFMGYPIALSPSVASIGLEVLLGAPTLLLGSIVVGVVLALALVCASQRVCLRDHPRIEALMLITFAYFVFAAAESVNLSGVIAGLSASCFAAIYMRLGMSKEGLVLSHFFIKQITFIAVAFAYLFVGVLAVWLNRSGIVLGAIMCGACLLGRASSIFPIGLLYNVPHGDDRQRLNLRQITMIWHAGLRGIMALSLTCLLGDWVEVLEGKQALQTIQGGVFVTIMTLTCLLGTTTNFCLNFLSIPMGDDVRDKCQPVGQLSWLARRFTALDEKVMRPLALGGDTNCNDATKEDIADVSELLRSSPLLCSWTKDVSA